MELAHNLVDKEGSSPMGPCVADDVHQGACPQWAVPSRSCLGGGVVVHLLVRLLVVVRLLAPGQSPRSSTRWGTPL